MYNNNKILVVIPARGGSKRIPRKNTRLLGDKPLIAYSIEMAKASEYVDDVVVSTEDYEISFIAEKFGASVVKRSEELAGDDSRLDPVVFEAMVQKEKLTFDEYDIVITVQPTSPLLKTSSLNKIIEKFDDFSIDSVIGVVDDRHLNWGYDEKNERYFPLYMERVDPQDLPKSFRETGAVLATRRSFVNENSRLGTNIDVFELSDVESVDITSYEGWVVAENYLKKKRIAFVTNACDELGTVYMNRCLNIASKLISDDVLFFINESKQLGIDMASKNFAPFKLYDDRDDLVNALKEFNPDIVVNDILDTSEEYINSLKNEGYFVCNFEDLGVGSNYADIVFDDLYEHDLGKNNVFTGHKYYILSKEFFLQPHKVITQKVDNVLITFGANDTDNFTGLVLDALLESGREVRINVILRRDYPDIEEFVSKYESNPLVQIYTNVPKLSDFMFQADIIFTSTNKTMYDACSLGIPTICIAQNDREKTHAFSNANNGFINMGLGTELTKEDIINQFNNLVDDFDLRLEMSRKMLGIDLKHGFENIKAVVEERYRNFKLTENQ